jgi:excinuclease ABC subunit B
MFKLESEYQPTGDQPNAINSIIQGLTNNNKYQCLEGVTGSGKTFTIANVIKQKNTPTLVLCHNKTLAAQLYEEFKIFFPENAVEYFVSYYDYYQPEAYLPASNTYIEKDLSINEEIEKFRISATNSLLSGRNDVIVIASVSCIYGIGNPLFFKEKTITITKSKIYERKELLKGLIEGLYTRIHDAELNRGEFKVIGDTFIIYPSSQDFYYKIHFWDNEVEKIEKVNKLNKQHLECETIKIPPANIFITSKLHVQKAIPKIEKELAHQIHYFNKKGQVTESKRIEERVKLDIEMIKELGYCSGIENYSRYLDGRKEGERPFCLMDYFPENFLLIIDESHVTIPQVKAMHGGDKARKNTLVEYGFRLPSALDNRPLAFTEFENIPKQVVFLSATPGDYELRMCEGVMTEQLIRPTGLLEPKILIHPCKNQIDNLMTEIYKRIEKKQRVLVTTLTKKMAEKLSQYLMETGIKSTYIHSDVDTLERVEIMKNLRLGTIDVLIGVNLLREGLDLPEVSLVAILDADKEGFLRSKRSLIQTIGRAARHVEGTSILYADKMTDSMKETIYETDRKRNIQIKYNKKHKITPKALKKNINLKSLLISNLNNKQKDGIMETQELETLSVDSLKKEIRKMKRLMNSAAIEMDFLEAAKYRDNLFILQNQLKKLRNN